jgi:hypothetical protein
VDAFATLAAGPAAELKTFLSASVR